MNTKSKTVWTLADCMRLSHPKGVDRAVGNFILRNEVNADAPAVIHGFKAVQAAASETEVIRVLSEHKNLPWEAIPTQFLKSAGVWKAIFCNGALNGQALLRNVTRLARIGAFDDMKFAADYAQRLADPAMIERTRLHPMAYLNAMVTYTEGQVERGGYIGWYAGGRKRPEWKINSKIKKALDDGFYAAFRYVEPANARTLIGLDVSGSMESFASGLDLTCSMVGGAMAMTVLRTEPYAVVHGFSGNFVDLGITEDMSLTEVMNQIRGRTFGSTDASLPMLYALENDILVDHFIVITDNDTWSGRMKPVQALDAYKSRMNPNARLSVVGLNSTEFTIADPKRTDMMDVVGGDANLPRLLAEFGSGRI